MTSILPFLLLLLCPIAMIFMMRGMHKHASQDEAPDRQATGQTLDLAQLHDLRSDLETRMEDLDACIYELETSADRRQDYQGGE